MLTKENIQQIYRLSPMQEGLFFHSLFLKDSTAYHVQITYRVQGRLDISIVKRSLDHLFKRYDILRTVFVHKKSDKLLQVVLKDRNCDFTFIELTNNPNGEAAALQYKQNDRNKIFDLTRDVLMRVTVLQLAHNSYEFIWTYHHILMDGWCMTILRDEFSKIYTNLLNGNVTHLPPARPYSDYINWLETYDRNKGLAYWKENLSGYTQSSGLPKKSSAASIQSGIEIKRHLFRISPERTRKLHSLAISSKATLNMIIQCIWSILLSKYNGVREVVFGIVVSGRPPQIAEIERMIGLFINTLPIRIQYNQQTTWKDLVQIIKHQNIQSEEYQYCSLAEVQSQSALKRDLFDHIFIFNNYPLDQEPQATAERDQSSVLISDVQGVESTQYDLTIEVFPGNTIAIALDFNINSYEKWFIESVSSHFNQIIDQLDETTINRIDDLELLTKDQKNGLLKKFSRTGYIEQSSGSIIEIFQKNVQVQPYKTAVVFENRALTYSELNIKSDRFARHLQQAAVKKEDIVAVLMERSDDMLALLLAIWKVGAAYLPLDTAYPVKRIQGILENSKASVLVIAGLDAQSYRESNSQITIFDLQALQSEHLSDGQPLHYISINPCDLAYVIYTSGSTGAPKGAMIEHKGMLNHLYAKINELHLDKNSIIAQNATHTFDISIWQFLAALLVGGSTVVYPRKDILQPERFIELLTRHKTTILEVVPSYLSMLLQVIQQLQERPEISLKYLIVTGEELKGELVKRFYKTFDKIYVVNAYGPTEASDDITHHIMAASPVEDLLPIGHPIQNTCIYIIDPIGHLCPPGIKGEIYVSGDGVGRGYLGNEVQTKASFLPDPYIPSRKMYKTGDIGSYHPDGNIYFFGRIDHQVKINGYRIELGEIESQLMKIEGIEIAVAKVDESIQQIVSYFVGTRAFSPIELRTQLESSLPVYMIPSFFIQLKNIPLTENGKIDIKSLSPINRTEISTAETGTSISELQKNLKNIFQEVLASGNVSLSENFFLIGGDSLKAIPVVNKIRKKIDLAVEIQDIFLYPTIAQLAYALESRLEDNKRNEQLESAYAYLEEWKEAILTNAVQASRLPVGWEDFYPMSDIEKGMVFYSVSFPEQHYYIDQFFYQFEDDSFELPLFRNALRLLVDKHEILRTCFLLDEFEVPAQVVMRDIDTSIEYNDLSEWESARQQEFLFRHSLQLRDKPFDFKKPGLWRAKIIKLSSNSYGFFWMFHHAILDGLSNALLMTELTQVYYGTKKNPGLGVQPLKNTYKDLIVDQYLARINPEIKAYWRKTLDNFQRTQLPLQKSIENFKGKEDKLFFERLDRSLVSSITELSRRLNTSVKEIYLSAFLYLIKFTTNTNDLTIGLVTNTRPQIEDGEKLVGCFLNTVPFRISIPDNITAEELILTTAKNSTELKSFDRLSLSEICNITQLEKSAFNPFFDVIYNYIDYYVYESVHEESRPQHGIIEGYFRTNTFFDFNVNGTKGQEEVTIAYNSAFFSTDDLTRLFNYYCQILRLLAGNLPLNNILNDSEKKQILIDFNNTSFDIEEDQTIVDLFAKQVSSTPRGIALIFKQQQLSYYEVHEKSNQIAHYLRNKGVTRNSLVALCMERSLELIISIFGVLKSGGAYVPIDPDYPADRVRFILEDIDAKFIIIDSSAKGIPDEIECINIATAWETISHHPVTDPDKLADAGDLCYVLYTSGSTGKPKGVLLEHRAVVNCLQWSQQLYKLGAQDTVLQKTTFCFDVSVMELIWPLLTGAKLVITEPEKHKDSFYLKEIINRYSVTMVHFAPSMLEVFLKDINTGEINLLKHVICIGEALLPSHVTAFKSKLPHTRLHNMYGPTEAAIIVTHYPALQHTAGKNVSIGTPIGNTQLYILDAQLSPCPVGVSGELYIGGVQLARGYLNRPELTAERFVINPFDSKEGNRLYKTGDRARWQADGNIEFLGRLDDQVKIRGYRIELNEVESALQEVEGVQDCCVVAGENRLTAYCVTDELYLSSQEKILYTKQIESWLEVYDRKYEDTFDAENIQFNIGIWNDSFTGLPIPAADMRQWQHDIVQKILSYQPQHILEIGSGTGLLYFPLAPHIQSYTGTDLSNVSINQLRQAIKQTGVHQPLTKLYCYPAHLVADIDTGPVDTILINSVVQYFPGLTYLSQVISQCVQRLLDHNGGRIIIGDVRDYRSLRWFKTRLLLDKQALTTTEDFMWKVEQELLREEELCIDPLYFISLTDTIPEISYAELEWKQADYDNELSRYRYTVTLHIGNTLPIHMPDWQQWDAARLLRYLQQGQQQIAMQEVPNPRLFREAKLSSMLHAAHTSLPEIQQQLQATEQDNTGVSQLLHQAAALGYSCRWFLNQDPLLVDILLEKHPTQQGPVVARITTAQAFANQKLSNRPLLRDISTALQELFRNALLQKLPEYMVPYQYVIIGAVPLTSNGKANRKLFARQQQQDQWGRKGYIAPRTELEKVLIEIWSELLKVERVGIQDNFFELGGHSLLATRVLSVIRRRLSIEAGVKDLFLYPTVEELAQYLTAKAPVALLPPVVAVPKRPGGLLPVSFSQERLWFIDRLQGSVQYHMPAVMRLKGNINVQMLEQGLRTIITRHEVLRTVLIEQHGVCYQQVKNQEQWMLPIVAFEDSDDTAIRQYIAQNISRPFNLSADYMLRAELLKISSQEYILIVIMHHIASDGWSLPILIKELSAIYSAGITVGEPGLPELEVQYSDYAIWQRTYLEGAVLQQQLLYWKNKLEGIQPLNLPLDHARPALQSGKGASISKALDKGLVKGLRELSTQEGATLYMVLLSAFKALLYRYSGSEDIAVGTSIANRRQQETESLVGFFVNTLVVRSELKGELSFQELLRQLKATLLEAYEHQDAPFEKVVDTVGTERDLSRSPLFQVMFTYQTNASIDENASLELQGVELKWENFDNEWVKFEIDITISEWEDELLLNLEYATDLFKRSTMERLLNHYEQLLKAVTKDRHQPLWSLSLLTEAERNKILYEFNKTELYYDKSQTVIDLFENQAIVTPNNIAVIAGPEVLNYKKLSDQSTHLAHYLTKKHGVASGIKVGIMLNRSANMIIAILGILKTGASYVPIDPAYPTERINYMLSDSQSAIVVCDSKNTQSIQERAATIVTMEDCLSASVDNTPLNQSNPKDVAYVIYTSGSTGQPKGVEITHSNAMAFISWARNEFDANKFDSLLAVTSICFDLSIYEFFYTLSTGKCIKILESALAIKEQLSSTADNTDRHLLNTVPSVVDMLLRDGIDLSSITILNIAGEPIPYPLKEKIDYKRIEVRNLYGPTEATTYSSYYRFREEDELIPIGRPVSNTQLYILDTHGGLCPIGIAGELHIGGDGISRGYLNRPELTKERFISNLFSAHDKTLLYKTGDIARWHPDGNVEFLGRYDDQVKIRGFRIELGEVENALQSCDGISQCVVIADDNGSGSKRLIGYLVPLADYDHSTVYDQLRSRLPDYMIPTVLLELDSIPLTANGKTDKRALPKPDISLKPGYAAPRSELEKQLAEIWGELLRLERIGIKDNFFALGGHSLLATRVLSLIRRRLSMEAEVRDLFLYPTIEVLASYLTTKTPKAILPGVIAVTKRPGDLLPVSFSQERLWFIDRLQGSIQYHMPTVMRLKGKIRVDVLEQSLRTIVARHEVLRTVLVDQDGTCFQQIKTAAQWTLTVKPFKNSTETAINHYITQSTSSPFDLSTDYMLRVELLELSSEEYILIAVMHHIAADGWSLAILVKELVELYAAGSEERQPTLPELEVQYSDYAIWQRTFLEGAALEQQLQYWKNKLEAIQPLDLPLDHLRPAVQSGKGNSIGMALNKELSKALKELSIQEGVTLYMTLLSAFKILLYHYSDSEDIAIGTPIANRRQQETESLVGFFVNTLVVRSEIKSELSFKELLKQVKDNLLEAYEHQDAPFEKIVDAVGIERDLSRSPLFQVMFVLQNIPNAPELQLGQLALHFEGNQNGTSKFDLNVMAIEGREQLYFEIEYSTDLFEQASIERMGQHYEELLNNIVANRNQKISALRLLNAREKQQVVKEFNNTYTNHGIVATVADLFEEQAAMTPDAIAVTLNDTHINYRELEEKSNQLAHYLHTKGIGVGTLVPVYMDRSIIMLTSIIGILKSGAAYVPIDISYPDERIQYILSDVDAGIILTDGSIKYLPENIIEINPYKDIELSTQSKGRIKYTRHPDDICYIIYTSGTTGKPKGVRMSNAALVNLLQWQRQEFTSSNNRILQFASINFDVSFQEIFTALSTGSTLELITDNDRKDFGKLVAKVNQTAVTHLFVPYIVLQGVAEYCSETGYYPQTLKSIITAGEQLKLTPEIRLLTETTGATLINQYGPTEAHVVSSYRIQSEDYLYRQLPPIGRPISNTQLYILDKNQQPCPIGVPGELYIGGISVAKGYQNLPELSAEKFIPDSFTQKPGARLYKTGDRSRWLADGNIEFLGRRDEQVKIRGYRIEPGEVESALQSCHGVGQCVVIADTDGTGSIRLIGYIVPLATYDRSTVLDQLRSKLPDYMIPAVLMELDNIQLTSNGKVDKRSLPKPDVSIPKAGYVAPRTELEKQITEIWRRVLGLDRIGINENFFTIGGHSLKAMQLTSRIHKILHVEVSLQELFKYPTILELTAVITSKEKVGYNPITKIAERSYYEISNAQKRIWIHCSLDTKGYSYNMPYAFVIEGELNIEILKNSLDALLDRHESLRTTFITIDGIPRQRINTTQELGFNLEIVKLENDPAKEILSKSMADQYAIMPFQLEGGALIRSKSIRLSEQKHILLLTLHHIICDGWSARILIDDLTKIYLAYSRNEIPSLSPLQIQYKDYTYWQLNKLNSLQVSAYIDSLQGKIQKVNLPYDTLNINQISFRGKTSVLELSTAHTTALWGIARKLNSNISNVILAIYIVFLHKLGNQRTISLGIGHSNRTNADIENLIGFFVNILVIAIDLEEDITFEELVNKASVSLSRALEYVDYPFDLLVEKTIKQRTEQMPLNVMFDYATYEDIVFHDKEEQFLKHDATTEQRLYEMDVKFPIAKFDLTLFASNRGKDIHIRLEYNADLFSENTIDKLQHFLLQIIESVTNH